jgi:hypothetical protein
MEFLKRMKKAFISFLAVTGAAALDVVHQCILPRRSVSFPAALGSQRLEPNRTYLRYIYARKGHMLFIL